MINKNCLFTWLQLAIEWLKIVIWLEMVLERPECDTPAQTVTRQADNFDLWTIMSAAWKGGLPSKSVHVLCCPFQISIIFNSVGFVLFYWGGGGALL